MNETSPSAEPLRAAYQEALSEERVLWRRVAVPALPPDERVQAYGRWRAAADRVKALSLQLQQARDAGSGQPPGPQAG
ncbi:hypothetical protein RAMLITH_02525 [Ramlibacter sp. RBP-2]|uniref:Uncharacterized protein n=1 Tax=Ramlibacter lithotrophicus TaxID=2606681 RepID=A0A7X6DCJ4_9BURK|nr:hypothetical protein [Ramlibacter lithotrophicus]NKE64685.1 hypothetical protein [Ramlibacter lithotrophicus]